MTHFSRRLSSAALLVAALGVALGASAGGAFAQQLPPRQGEDDPRARSDYFEQQRAYPFPRIPAGARYRALQSMRLRNLTMPSALASPMGAWQSMGPAPIAGNNSGRVAAIAVHPTNPQIIYAGGAQGGVWKTTNGGASWTPLGDAQCSLAIGSITIDPVNPNIVYAGTGEENFSQDSYYGCGILRTTDGGATWTTLGQGTFQTSNGGARIAKILIDPATAGTTSATLYAATTFGLYKSVDGGNFWSQVLNKGYSYVTDVVMPGTPGNPIFAASAGPFTNAANGVYESGDGGITWALVGGGLPTTNVGRIAIAVSPLNKNIMWVSVENPSSGNLTGLYRTGDGGVTWAKVGASGVSCSAQCWYAMVVTASPTDTNTVYFSGLSLYRSVDGGASFSDVALPVHVDHHALSFDPTTPTTMYAGTDGGVFKSADQGSTWSSLNTNLSITQFYGGFSLHPTSGAMLGGAQDNGTLEYTGSSTWGWVLGGDGGFTAINPDNPTIGYAETQWSAFSGYSGPRRRTTPGAGFALANSGIGLGDNALFIPPLVLDPAHSSYLYFGTSKLYRTRNGGDSWSTFGTGMFVRGGNVSAIGVAQSDTNTVYVGSNQGDIAVTTDGGATWRAITGLPSRYITSITVNRANPAIAYVTVSGFGTGHVWRTTNTGSSWTDLSANLPNIPVNGFALVPGGEFDIGTDLGVFRSSDDGASWSVASTGLPNVAVYDVVYNLTTKTLAAATHGRGAWTVSLTPTLTPTQVFVDAAPSSYTSGALTRTFSVSLREVTGVTVPGASNAITATITAGGGTLNGTTTVSAVSGMANFFAMSITGSGPQTVTFSAAGMTPASVVVRMVVPVTMSLSPTSSRDSVLAGATTAHADSASLTMTGDSAAVTAWTATKAHAWTTLTTASGTGPGRVRWTRNPTGLAVGKYVDTITVTAPQASNGPLRIIDTLVVRPSVVAVSFAGDTIRGAQNDVASIDLQADLSALPGSALLAYAATVSWDSSVVRLDSARAIASGFAAPAATAAGLGKLQLSASQATGRGGAFGLARLYYRFVSDSSGRKSALTPLFTTLTSGTNTSLLGTLAVSNGGAVAVGVLRGDVNGDGQLTAADAQLILQAAAGLPLAAPAKALQNGDANCNGKLEARDAQIVLAKLVGLPVGQFCVGKVR
ncbi:MAG: hypothetical protein HY084_13835 [Gemmatimonadetes bacterium]|nr:hypothetical protein [Gemmatimonadota bacterium]